jgi:hypothetical protein
MLLRGVVQAQRDSMEFARWLIHIHTPPIRTALTVPTIMGMATTTATHMATTTMCRPMPRHARSSSPSQ